MEVLYFTDDQLFACRPLTSQTAKRRPVESISVVVGWMLDLARKNWLRFSPTLPLYYPRGQKVQKFALIFDSSGFWGPLVSKQSNIIWNLKHALEAPIIGLCPLQTYFAHPSPNFYIGQKVRNSPLTFDFKALCFRNGATYYKSKTILPASMIVRCPPKIRVVRFSYLWKKQKFRPSILMKFLSAP